MHGTDDEDDILLPYILTVHLKSLLRQQTDRQTYSWRSKTTTILDDAASSILLPGQPLDREVLFFTIFSRQV